MKGRNTNGWALLNGNVNTCWGKKIVNAMMRILYGTPISPIEK